MKTGINVLKVNLHSGLREDGKSSLRLPETAVWEVKLCVRVLDGTSTRWLRLSTSTKLRPVTSLLTPRPRSLYAQPSQQVDQEVVVELPTHSSHLLCALQSLRTSSQSELVNSSKVSMARSSAVAQLSIWGATRGNHATRKNEHGNDGIMVFICAAQLSARVHRQQIIWFCAPSLLDRKAKHLSMIVSIYHL